MMLESGKLLKQFLWCAAGASVFTWNGRDIQKTIMKWCGYELIKWYTMAKSAIFKAQEREVLQKFASTANHYHSAKGMQLKLAALQMLSYVHAFHEFSKKKDGTGCHPIIANCDSLKQAWGIHQ